MRNNLIAIMKTKLVVIITLAFLAIAFFTSAGSYIFFSQKDGFIKWSSPDETSNYFFSLVYAQEGELGVFEKFNLYAKDIIHPRSFRSDFGVLKPVSFLGLPLVYGKIASFTTGKLIGFMTPFLAAIGIIYYYLFLKIFFSRRVALFSALLLAIFPVYFYYTARSMFHNVPFTVFLIIGLYYALISSPDKDAKNDSVKPKAKRQKAKENDMKIYLETVWVNYKQFIFAALGGFFIGLAVTMRSSEVLWLGPVIFVIWIFNFWRFGISRFVIFLSFLALAILPIFYWNNILYQSPFRGGYPEMNQSISTVAGSGQELAKAMPSLLKGSVGQAKGFIVQIKRAIFSFGFNIPRSIKIFNLYFVKMFPWLFWPSLAGALIFILHFRKIKKKHLLYLLCYAFLSLVLVIYYGSWEFYDNPDRTAATIGNSYTRYWLPVYLGAIPFVSYLLFKIVDLPKLFLYWGGKLGLAKRFEESSKRLFKIFGAFLVGLAAIFFINLYANFILFGSEEGLAPTYYRGVAARLEYDKVISLTENNSVVITRYHDKLLFPERKVVMGQFDDPSMIQEYAHIAEHLPLYYYNFSYTPAALDYLNQGALEKVNLKMEKIEKITKDFTLYKLELVKTAKYAKTRNKNRKN